MTKIIRNTFNFLCNIKSKVIHLYEINILQVNIRLLINQIFILIRTNI